MELLWSSIIDDFLCHTCNYIKLFLPRSFYLLIVLEYNFSKKKPETVQMPVHTNSIFLLSDRVVPVGDCRLS